MFKKEITALPDGLVEAVASKSSYAIKSRELDAVNLLEHKMNVINTKLMSARNGGMGNVASLHEEKLILARQIQEAKAARNADKAEGDTKTPNVEATVKTPDGTADKKTPARKGDLSNSDSIQKVKEEVELDEAVNVKAIQKAVDDGKSMDVIMTMFANKRTTNTDEIRKVVQDYKWNKRTKKEDVEITELHMALLEAHGIEKKMAERIKKVFDAMSTEDKAAFMKSYLKNPKAATEYMSDQIMKGVKAAGGMNMKEEAELDEAAQPKWKVQFGNKYYTVTARNTAEANQKAKKLAAKDGNSGIGGKIERINEAIDSVDAKALKGKHSDRKDKDIDNDGDVDSSDEYLHKRRQAISKALKKEEVELDEAKRDASDFEAMDPPNGIDYDDKNLRKLNWKMYDDKAIRDIIKRADSNADERSPHGPDYQASGKAYYQNIIKAAKAELKKRGIKEEVELDEADTHKTKDGGTAKKGLWYNINKKKERGEKSNPEGHPDRPSAQDFKDARKTTKESVELDESITKLSNARLKYHATKDFPHGSFSNAEIKGEHKRRMKAEPNYHKVKPSLSEEVQLDEVSNAVKDQLANIDLSIRDWEKRWKNKSAGNPNDMKAPQKINDLKAQKAALMKKHGIKEEVELDEAKGGYTINHTTFSSAVQHAKAQVEKQGYTIDDDEWDRKVAMGPKKPGTGKTNRYTIALMKGGKESKRNLQMQVYYDEGRYELNMYVS